MIVPLLPLALLLVLLILIEPWVTYFMDAKKLRRFPNATYFSGVSNLSFIVQRWRGFRSRDIQSAHEQHPILRIGPNALSFSSPGAIRAIYGHSTPCTKGGVYEAVDRPHPGLIDMIDKERHAQKRRILSNAFATRNLEHWEFKVADKIQRLVRHFDKICHEGDAGAAGTSIVDFRRWSNLFSVEAIADIALSEPLGLLEKGDDSIAVTTTKEGEKQVRFIQSLHSSRRATSMIAWTPWFRSLKFVLEKLPGFFGTQWKLGGGFDEILEHLVRNRVQKYAAGEELDDLARCLLQDKTGQSRNPSSAEMEGDVAALLDAGSDTTAIALTHVMYFLLKTPTALAQLRQELDTHARYSNDDLVDYDSVKNLPYLRACLDESLRILPPLPGGLQRLTPREGLEIDGQWIPGKTIVTVPSYTAHRNPELFPDPEKYQPERWLKESSKEAQASFIPFSTGARGCIGRNITYIEQTMLLATLVRRYDFSFVDPNFKLDHEEAFLLWSGPMPLNLKRRDTCLAPQ